MSKRILYVCIILSFIVVIVVSAASINHNLSNVDSSSSTSMPSSIETQSETASESMLSLPENNPSSSISSSSSSTSCTTTLQETNTSSKISSTTSSKFVDSTPQSSYDHTPTQKPTSQPTSQPTTKNTTDRILPYFDGSCFVAVNSNDSFVDMHNYTNFTIVSATITTIKQGNPQITKIDGNKVYVFATQEMSMCIIDVTVQSKVTGKIYTHSEISSLEVAVGFG